MTITFDGISIAASGMNAYQTWLDAIADNIANINTITAVVINLIVSQHDVNCWLR